MMFGGDWVQADLMDAAAVTSAVAKADTVVHCASTPLTPTNDPFAIQHLISAPKSARAQLVYVSICGIEEASK
jgi:uncharacterized protein YbjT (DUF2867 family)